MMSYWMAHSNDQFVAELNGEMFLDQNCDLKQLQLSNLKSKFIVWAITAKCVKFMLRLSQIWRGKTTNGNMKSGNFCRKNLNILSQYLNTYTYTHTHTRSPRMYMCIPFPPAELSRTLSRWHPPICGFFRPPETWNQPEGWTNRIGFSDAFDSKTNQSHRCA